MPGWIRLAYGREPNFFHGVDIQGSFNQVLVAEEADRLVGTGCRSIKPAWVNGVRQNIGYLSGLRLSPDVRRTGALARAYAACKVLHDQRPAPAYLTTVVEGNTEATRLLTSGRAGLPHYLDRGRYVTYAINLNCRARRPSPCGLTIRHGGEVPQEDIVAFLNHHGARRQFFPVLSVTDFGTPYLRGLHPADFCVAVDGAGGMAGVAAVWDQGGFKQNTVTGYAGPVQHLRPALNGVLRLTGFHPLPAPGEDLRLLYAAFACVRGNDPATLRAMLEHLYAQHQRGHHHFLVLGFHERDPLRAALSRFLAFRYVSRLYLVCWDDGLDFVNRLDPDLIPYLDAATL